MTLAFFLLGFFHLCFDKFQKQKQRLIIKFKNVSVLCRKVSPKLMKVFLLVLKSVN